MNYFEKKVAEKVQKKWRFSWNWQNEDKTIFCCFFKCSLNFKAYAL